METAVAERQARLRKKSAAGQDGTVEVGIDRPSRSSKRMRRSQDTKAVEIIDLGEEAELEVHQSGEEEAEVVEVEREEANEGRYPSPEKKRKVVPKKSSRKAGHFDPDCCFIGDPLPMEEAKKRWPERYQQKENRSHISISSTLKKGDEDEVLKAECHYLQARFDGYVYNLDDCAYVKAGEGEDNYICRIVEFFRTAEQELYFTAQWFFRAEDTAIKGHANPHDRRRVFLSEERDDNMLDCLVSKIKIARVAPNIDLMAKERSIPSCDLYYDMSYSMAFSAFANLPNDNSRNGSDSACSESSSVTSDSEPPVSNKKSVLSLLDLYCGCGAMSTGLCLGANLAGLNLQTRWAVDLNSFACESLELNHPETKVRNEKAENFLALIREWEKLCKKYVIDNEDSSAGCEAPNSSDDEKEIANSSAVPKGEFEVERFLDICYGDPSNIGKEGIKFKVRWKGYGPSDDTWEPVDGLGKCDERIRDFVKKGHKKNILPLPGAVEVICGGPPCQGISGFNRFRRSDEPLKDPKNQQMITFMDIVEFLKPKYVLMENVVDILKFANAYLGRYALSRLVAMNYQARMGMMVAGCYGLPQFRMRVFLWGALPTEVLPKFPLPTHNVVVRGGGPNEFEHNMVAYDEHQRPELENALLLADAISDLPAVGNDEARDEMAYGQPPKTDFQRFIRLTKAEMLGSPIRGKASQKGKLFDHRPLQLNKDDYQRVCQIPKRKGANFRDLPGVLVGPDNVVEWDPNVERVYLPSGKPLVPDYAMSFIKGKSPKPFGRLWWDETVATVVTRAEPHNQVVLHPEQDRVLSIRENARLQGFPDYYQLRGPIKERYIQVGNAVAVPVARALGYAMGLAFKGNAGDGPLLTLPGKFPRQVEISCNPTELNGVAD